MSGGTYVEFKKRGGSWRVRVDGLPWVFWANTRWGAKRMAKKICREFDLPAPSFAANPPHTEDGKDNG